MNFDLEYKLQQFRKEQNELFDNDDKRYAGTPMPNRTSELMLELINELEVLAKCDEMSKEIDCRMFDPKQQTGLMIDAYKEGFQAAVDSLLGANKIVQEKKI